jgi:hypothetical protein
MILVETYLFCVLGIAISIILPIIRQALPKPKGGTAGIEGFIPRLWPIAKPYLVLGVFSLVVGLLIVAFAGDTLADWRAALLVGYAWDSTLQKLKG